jgi:hypothetical protein
VRARAAAQRDERWLHVDEDAGEEADDAEEGQDRVNRPATALLLGTFAVALSLPACEGESGSAFYFPTWQVGAETPAGDLRGRLVAQNNCLFFDADGPGDYLPVWPSTFTLGGADTPVVTTDSGRELAVGDVVTLGGGERNRQSAEDVIREAIPERCAASNYWLTTEVIEEAS